jgi:hypothetical protein
MAIWQAKQPFSMVFSAVSINLINQSIAKYPVGSVSSFQPHEQVFHI